MPRYVTMANKIIFVWFPRKAKDVTVIGIFCYLSVYYINIVGRFKYWQVLAYTKNWKIHKIVAAMEMMRKVGNFFTFVFITQYKLKMGKVSEKSIVSISKP